MKSEKHRYCVMHASNTKNIHTHKYGKHTSTHSRHKTWQTYSDCCDFLCTTLSFTVLRTNCFPIRTHQHIVSTAHQPDYCNRKTRVQKITPDTQSVRPTLLPHTGTQRTTATPSSSSSSPSSLADTGLNRLFVWLSKRSPLATSTRTILIVLQLSLAL